MNPRARGGRLPFSVPPPGAADVRSSPHGRRWGLGRPVLPLPTSSPRPRWGEIAPVADDRRAVAFERVLGFSQQAEPWCRHRWRLRGRAAEAPGGTGSTGSFSASQCDQTHAEGWRIAEDLQQGDRNLQGFRRQTPARAARFCADQRRNTCRPLPEYSHGR